MYRSIRIGIFLVQDYFTLVKSSIVAYNFESNMRV